MFSAEWACLLSRRNRARDSVSIGDPDTEADRVQGLLNYVAEPGGQLVDIRLVPKLDGEPIHHLRAVMAGPIEHAVYPVLDSR